MPHTHGRLLSRCSCSGRPSSSRASSAGSRTCCAGAAAHGASLTAPASGSAPLAQLPLALAIEDHASFETFVGGGNSAAVEHVRTLAAGGRDTVWLWGAPGSGKSHLLQAACRAATAADRRAMYVAMPAVSPAILADLEQVDLLAIDDVHK